MNGAVPFILQILLCQTFCQKSKIEKPVKHWTTPFSEVREVKLKLQRNVVRTLCVFSIRKIEQREILSLIVAFMRTKRDIELVQHREQAHNLEDASAKRHLKNLRGG